MDDPIVNKTEGKKGGILLRNFELSGENLGQPPSASRVEADNPNHFEQSHAPRRRILDGDATTHTTNRERM